MVYKVYALILFASIILLVGCGDDGGTASGKWVGEVYVSPNSKATTVVGEYDSYDECVEASKKAAKTGVFNCGIK